MDTYRMFRGDERHELTFITEHTELSYTSNSIPEPEQGPPNGEIRPTATSNTNDSSLGEFTRECPTPTLNDEPSGSVLHPELSGSDTSSVSRLNSYKVVQDDESLGFGGEEIAITFNPDWTGLNVENDGKIKTSAHDVTTSPIVKPANRSGHMDSTSIWLGSRSGRMDVPDVTTGSRRPLLDSESIHDESTSVVNESWEVESNASGYEGNGRDIHIRRSGVIRARSGMRLNMIPGAFTRIKEGKQLRGTGSQEKPAERGDSPSGHVRGTLGLIKGWAKSRSGLRSTSRANTEADNTAESLSRQTDITTMLNSSYWDRSTVSVGHRPSVIVQHGPARRTRIDFIPQYTEETLIDGEWVAEVQAGPP